MSSSLRLATSLPSRTAAPTGHRKRPRTIRRRRSAIDPGVCGQERAGGVRPETVDHVVDARGHTDRVHDPSPSRVAVLGVSSDGLTTTVLPQASAGQTFHVINNSGRFHGQITAMTPRDTRTA